MRLVAIKGNNFKNYIQIILENNNEDFTILEEIRAVVSRTEYLPFVNTFNKNISETYLIDETYIPIQLWQDVYNKVMINYPNIKLENDENLYNTHLRKEHLIEYSETLNLPNYINLFADKYFYQLESVYRSLLFKQARIEISTGGG